MDLSTAAQPQSLLRSKRYFLFWLSSLFSNMGTWMQQVAQPWVILSMGLSSFWVGLDSFVLNAQGWIFTLWGGVLADRYDRKKIVLICQSTQLFCVALLFLLILTAKLNIWIILFSSFVIGLTDSLSMPSFQSIVPSLVKEEDVPRAIALNSTQFNLSRILGPSVAGALIAGYGAATCYGANVLSFLPFFLSLYLIYPKKVPLPTVGSAESSIQAFRHFKELLKKHDIQIPLATVFSTMLFGAPVMIFCSVLIKQVLMGNAANLGFAMASFGAGGVLGGGMTSIFSLTLNKVKNYSNFATITLGICIVLIAEVSAFLPLCILIFCCGAVITTSNITSNANLQKLTKNSTRGRVISLFQMSLQAGMATGAFFTGILATHYGVQRALLLDGIFLILVQFSIIAFQRKSAKG